MGQTLHKTVLLYLICSKSDQYSNSLYEHPYEHPYEHHCCNLLEE